MAFPAGWGRTQAITIDNTKVAGAGSHSNYPMLITLDHLDVEIVDAGSNSALNGGGDIRITSDSAGSTQLAIEVVSFVTNATVGSRECEIWVKVPSVSTSVDTVIYIWYKKSGEVQPAVTATYGRNAVWSSYGAVWHMTEASGSLIDSTGNGNNAASSGTPVYGAAAEFGDGIDFDGVAYFSAPSSTSLDLSGGSYTLSSWVKLDTSQVAWSTWLAKGDSTKGDWAFGRQSSGSQLNVYHDGDGGVNQIRLASTWGRAVNNVSHLTHVTYDGVTGSFYIDGLLDDALPFSVDPSHANKPLYIGRARDGQPIKGIVSEVRINTTVRSTGWIATEHNNQNAPATFATAGTPSTPGGGATTFFQTNTGSLTPSGGLSRRIDKILSGSITPTGLINKIISGLYSGALAIAGTVSTQVVILRSLSGSSSATGNLSRSINKNVAGSSAPIGVIQKKIFKRLEASLTLSGNLEKRIEKVLDGSLTPSGTLATTVVILVQLTGSLIMSGALAALFIAGTGAVSKFLGKILKPILRPILKKILKGHEDE